MSLKTLRHKTHERFSCFGINIFCQYEINSGIDSQGMLQHGSNGRGKASNALKQELGYKALEGTESSLFSHTLYFIWEIHQLTVTEHVNKFRVRYTKCCFCYPEQSSQPWLMEEWWRQHNGSVLGTIKHWIDDICFLAQTSWLVDKTKSPEIFDTGRVYCLRKSHGSHSSDKVRSVLF